MRWFRRLMTWLAWDSKGLQYELNLEGRPLLDDEAFYAAYYDGSDIRPDIPGRVRKVIAEQLSDMWLRVRPEDKPTDAYDDLDLVELFYDFEEEFRISIPIETIRQLDGSFDSMVKCVAAISHDATPPATSRRRWFRFSLRTLFVVVTVFGVWLGVQVKWIRDRHNWLREHSQSIIWPVQPEETEHRYDPFPAPWQLRILGEKGFRRLWLGFPEDVERAKALFPEAELDRGGVI